MVLGRHWPRPRNPDYRRGENHLRPRPTAQTICGMAWRLVFRPQSSVFGRQSTIVGHGWRTVPDLNTVRKKVVSMVGRHNLCAVKPDGYKVPFEKGLVSGSYRDLKAWQKSIDLVAEIYACTRSFPKEEQYGLVSQLRRAAVAVASNIAEGKGRSGGQTHSYDFCTKPGDHCAKSRPSLRLPIDWDF